MIAIFNQLFKNITSVQSSLRLIVATLLILVMTACSSVSEKPQLNSGSTMSGTTKPIEKTKVIDTVTLQEYQAALTYLDQGDLSEANELLIRIVEKYPNLAAPLYNLAIVLEELNDQDSAERYYVRAIEADSKYYMALNNLGIIARSKGQFNEASEYYSKGLKAAPNSPDLHYNLAVLNEIYLHDYAKAIKHYERYLTLVGSAVSSGADKNVSSWIKDLKRRSR